MPLLVSLVFVALAVSSVALQVGDHRLKRFVSPGLTAFTGLTVLYGTLAGHVPLARGGTVFVALLLLAASDFVFERTADDPGLFTTAMSFGAVSGFALGALFNVVAATEVSAAIHVACVVAAAAAALAVYRLLAVEPDFALALRIYLLEAVILLAGGLACLFGAQLHFAAWGILIFASDALVGVRAFPNPERPIRWLSAPRLLVAILVIYYPALYAMASWAVHPR